MKKAALESARERLNRAREAVSQLDKGKTHKEREKAWSHFLLAANAIYSKLEQGAKGSSSDEGWFGRKKHERRSDDLLRYIHQARNTDDHGISGTTLAAASMVVGKGPVYGIQPIIEDGDVKFEPIKHPDSVVHMTEYLALKMVSDDRFGDKFMPPKTHLGVVIYPSANEGDLARAVDIARLGLTYLEGLVDEAAKLTPHT